MRRLSASCPPCIAYEGSITLQIAAHERFEAEESLLCPEHLWRRPLHASPIWDPEYSWMSEVGFCRVSYAEGVMTEKLLWVERHAILSSSFPSSGVTTSLAIKINRDANRKNELPLRVTP